MTHGDLTPVRVGGGWTVSQRPKLINCESNNLAINEIVQELYSSRMLPSARRLIGVLLADTKYMRGTW